MAQYDGSIRILTKISTEMAEKSLSTLSQTIKGTAKEISSLRSKMDALKGQKFETQEFKDLKSDIVSAEKELSELISKQKKIPQTIADLSTEQLKERFANLNEELENTQGRIEQVKSAMVDIDKKISAETSKNPDADVSGYEQEFEQLKEQLHRLREEEEQIIKQARSTKEAFEISENIDRANESAEQLQEKLQDLEESGKAFTMGEETQEYANLERQLQYEEEALRKAQQLQEIAQRTGDPYARLSAALNDLATSLSNVLHPIEAMKSAFASAAETMKARAAGVAATIINGIAHPFQTMKTIASGAISTTSKLLSGMVSVTKKVGSAIKAVVSSLKKAIPFMSLFGKSAKSSSNILNSGFKNLLKYGLGIRSMYVLINKFRTAVKEGFGNLAQYSKPVNAALSSLKSALAQLKNSLATAFAPILTAVAPALTTLINLVSKAATAVGMLVAALTGQKSFIKATAVQEGYADSLGKTAGAAKKAVKALAGFDKLNVLGNNDSDDSGSGGGGGGAGVGNMFETVDIPSKISDLAKMIKDAWEKADFTEIGALIGNKLKDALDNIPWDKIQATAAKVGKSLATLIGGFVSVPGLGYSIGNTIAQAINTGLIGLNEFAKWLPWDMVGKFVGDGINGALENIDWKTAISAAKNLGEGIAKAINSFLETTDFTNVGKTIAKALNTAIQFVFSSGKTIKFELIGEKIADGINGFFKDFKAKKLAKTINLWIKGALSAASSLLKKTDFKMIGEKIGNFLASLDFKEAIKKLGNVLWEAVKGAFSLLSGLFKVAPLESSLIAAFSLMKFTALGKAFASNLSSSLSGAISSVLPGILAAFGEFMVISGTFESLTAGTDNFVAAIGKIAGAVTIAGAAMTAVFGFPAGIIAAAITGVAGAIAGTTTALDEMEQQMREEEEISKYGKTISEMADEIDRSSEAIKNRIAESEEYISTAGVAEAQMAQDLSDRYFELADKENKTNEEMEEMQRLAGLLVDKMPELNKYYNEQTGLLDTTKQSVDNLIQSRLQEIKLNAIEEQLTQAYKEQAEQLQKVEEAAVPVNDAQAKMNDLQEKLQELSKKQGLREEYDRLSTEIQYCTGDTEDLLKKQQELWNELTNGNTTTFPTPEALQQELIDTKKELVDVGEEYKKVIKSFATADEAYETVNGNISRLTKMFTEGMTDSANKGIEGYNQTIGNDKSMQNTATQSARDIVDAFNKGQDAHSPSRKFMEAAKYSIEGFVQGIIRSKQSALTTMTTLAKEIVQKFKDMKKDFESKGKDIISGIKSGIVNKWSEFYSYWTDRKNAIIDKFKDIKDKFITKGKNIISGIREGIKNLWAEFSSFWGEKKNSIINKFSDIKDKMFNVGKNIVNGIIEGIKSIWSTLAGIAQNIIDLFTIKVGASDGGGTTATSGASAASAQYASAYQSMAQIPALASGAVIRGGNPFIAELGDQPRWQTNIETPLPTMLKAMKQAIAESGGMGGGEYTFIAQLEGKTIFEETVRQNDMYINRTGRSRFTY